MAVVQAPVRNGPRLRHARRWKNDSLKRGLLAGWRSGHEQDGGSKGETKAGMRFMGVSPAEILAGNTPGDERGYGSQRLEVAVVMEHRQAVSDRAGSNQAIDAGADRQAGAAR